MVEDLKRKLLIVLAVPLLLSLAQAGNTDRLSGHNCTDFQTANFLRGTKLKVQFLLFTPSSPSCGELILAEDDIKNSSFNRSLETKIIIHGFRALGTKPSWIEELVHAILHTNQVNVIAVDWVYGSTAAYPSAVENVTQLALAISLLISKLLAKKIPISEIISGISTTGEKQKQHALKVEETTTKDQPEKATNLKWEMKTSCPKQAIYYSHTESA